MRKLSTLLLALLFCSVAAFAQTPAPVSSTLNFSVGGQMFGLGGATQATPASDVVLSLDPGFTNKYLAPISLRSDNILAPGAGVQFYGGGANYTLPFALPKTSPLAPISFYADMEFGVDRIVPATGPSVAHFAFMAGGGANWKLANGVTINLFEVNDLHAPGAPWGNDAPAISGGISYVFGKR